MEIGEQTCERHCERVAYQIEIKRLRAERDTALANWEHQKQEVDSLRAENERLVRDHKLAIAAIEGHVAQKDELRAENEMLRSERAALIDAFAAVPPYKRDRFRVLMPATMQTVDAVLRSEGKR
jgi:hypothetical protein